MYAINVHLAQRHTQELMEGGVSTFLAFPPLPFCPIPFSLPTHLRCKLPSGVHG